jgi:hypothetical protein
MSLPTWIRTELYNDVVNLQAKIRNLNQEGNIVITKDKAYFQNNDEIIEVLLTTKENTRARVIAEDLDKYKLDLTRFEIYPPEEVLSPYDENEDTSTKIGKLLFLLQQRRIAKDRFKTLIYYYLLGELVDKNGQQHLNQRGLNDNQVKKLKLKSYRTYHLFKDVGLHQIYNTKYITVSILAEMERKHYEDLLHYDRVHDACI